MQQTVFELINGTAGLSREFFKSDPNQQSTADMIALNAGIATLTLFQTGHLFAFSMQLLDLPAEATHLLGRLCGILNWIIGHDPIRAVGRHLDPETLHLVLFGKAFDLDRFAVPQFVFSPGERVRSLIGLYVAGIVDLPVVFERAVINLLQRLDQQH